MKSKNLILQMAVMIVAASCIAVIANGFAGNTRRLVLPGFYPNALRVPPPETETPAPIAPLAPAATVTMQSPGPGQPPMIVPTTTVERPAGDPAATMTAATTTNATATASAPMATTTAAPAPFTPAPAPQPAADPLARFQPHPDKPYVEIGGDDVALLHSRGALFLDARRTSVYEEGHIAGARSFSVWEADIDDKVNNLFNERGNDPREQNLPIVIYCSGGACEDSHMLAQKLWGVQFNNVYVYKDGYPDWQKRGGAVKTGGNP
jgi:rhodanese-related sulfurtransferase